MTRWARSVPLRVVVLESQLSIRKQNPWKKGVCVCVCVSVCVCVCVCVCVRARARECRHGWVKAFLWWCCNTHNFTHWDDFILVGCSDCLLLLSSAFYAQVDTVIFRNEVNNVSCILSFPMLQCMTMYFVVSLWLVLLLLAKFPRQKLKMYVCRLLFHCL